MKDLRNLAEGCGRRGDRESRRFLDIAMGSACELECETILSFDLVFITDAMQESMLAVFIEVKRMLSGLMNRLLCHPRLRRPRGQGNTQSDPPAPAHASLASTADSRQLIADS